MCLMPPANGFPLVICIRGGAKNENESSRLSKMQRYEHSFRHNTGIGGTDITSKIMLCSALFAWGLTALSAQIGYIVP